MEPPRWAQWLLVLAVFGFLGCCLFPLPPRPRPAARRMACLSNLKQLVGALRLYASDYDDRLPPHLRAGEGGQVHLPFLLGSYSLAPGNPGGSYRWWCPEVQDSAHAFDGTPGDTTVSYGYNWLGLSPNGKPAKLSQVRSEAETVAFVDADGYLASPGPPGGSPLAHRHQGRINVAWLDGHVKNHPRGVLEQTAPAESTKQLGPGIDAYLFWNLK